MRMKQIILAILILGLSSCGVAPTASKFPVEKIDLGTNKSNVKSLCGKPFRSDIFTKKSQENRSSILQRASSCSKYRVYNNNCIDLCERFVDFNYTK